MVVGCSHVGPGASAPYNASNAAKMTEAAAFAGTAAVAQVVASAMEAHARNNAPVGHSSTGLRATPDCDNEGQYPCVSVSGSPSATDPARAPEPEMSGEEARGYVLDYLNAVRRLHGAGALVRDPSAESAAQAESEALSHAFRADQPASEDVGPIDPTHAELQAAPEAPPARLLQDRLGGVLLQWMDEKPEGAHRATLMRPEWRKIGVGIVTRDGRTYFTVDFSS
jgi:uncharacterized protein YkwD